MTEQLSVSASEVYQGHQIGQSEMTKEPVNTPEEASAEDATYDISEFPPAAQRALAEAEARRKSAADTKLPRELGGRDGPEPVRYGDWEKKGIAVDF